MADNSWFGVRCIFSWVAQGMFEERITVWRADDIDEAIAMAERDAIAYAGANEMEYLGLAQAYAISGGAISSGSEVFSLMRESSLEPEEYLDEFFDTGTERQRT